MINCRFPWSSRNQQEHYQCYGYVYDQGPFTHLVIFSIFPDLLEREGESPSIQTQPNCAEREKNGNSGKWFVKKRREVYDLD